jgi:NitT/TauT family transport system ATP-binding protein
VSRPVTFRDIWMSFPGKDGGSVDVLVEISLAVAAGELICIVGPSGCGKSTLLNIAAGFVPASRGQVLVGGAPVLGPDPRWIFIFQENGVFPWLTVEQNIGFGLGRRPAAERRRIVAHYTEMMGLGGFGGSYPRQLSGGMKQRVELARALAAEPEVLFMDEPFGALDYLTRLRMRAELVRIWQRERKTVLFVTHDVEEAVQLADRVVVLGQRPARIRAIVEIDLPRPRDVDHPRYRRLRDEIFGVMGLDHLGQRAGAPAGAAPGEAPAAQDGISDDPPGSPGPSPASSRPR